MFLQPELNLNKHPRDVNAGSIIGAHNMKISKDTNLLQTENTLDDYNVNQIIKDIIENDEYKIISAITCNTEIVFIVDKDFNNTNAHNVTLVRYDEKQNKASICCEDFEYNGGKLISTFTYNHENLVVAIAEYFEDDRKMIPLKTLNLGKFGDNITGEFYKHPICPEVRIPYLNTELVFGNSYKGWYYIFIRYQIKDNDYTQWFNTNKVIYIDSFNEEFIENYYLGADSSYSGSKYTMKDDFTRYKSDIGIDGKFIHKYAKDTISNNKDICENSFNIYCNNLDDRYNNYQLGFICVSKDYTKAFRTENISILLKNNVYNFNLHNIVEESANNIIKNYDNYFNVKNIDNINNKLYIANYQENNNEDDIRLQSFITFTFDDAENNNSYTKPRYSKNTNKETDDEHYSTLIFYTDGNIKIGEVTKALVTSVNGITSVRIALPDMLVNKTKYHNKLINNYKIAKNITGFDNNMSIYILNNKERIDISTYQSYYVIENFNTDNEIHYYEVYDRVHKDSGKLYADDLYHTGGSSPFYWNLGETKGDTMCELVIFNDLRYGKFIIQSENNIIRDNDNVNDNNILNSSGFIPDSYYAVYLHFVDKYGKVTKGIDFSKIGVVDNLDNVDAGESYPAEAYNNLNGNLVIKCPYNDYNIRDVFLNGYCYIEFHNNELSDLKELYSGMFVSYEKFESTIKHKGLLTVKYNNITQKYEYHFYNDSLNYSEKIDFNFNQLRVIKKVNNNIIDNKQLYSNANYNIDEYSEPIYTGNNQEDTTYNINHKNLLVADSGNNILKSTTINLELEKDITGAETNKINYFIVYLINENQNKYVSKNKELIPCSQIYYFNDNYKYKLILNPHNCFISTNHILYFDGTSRFDSSTLRFMSYDDDDESGEQDRVCPIIDAFINYQFKDYIEIPNESIIFNNAPHTIIFPIRGLNTTDEKSKSYIAGKITDIKDTIDVFKQPQLIIYENYPKPLYWWDVEIKTTNEFFKTIRRSNVIQDESHINAWRQFEFGQYKIIQENKGYITNLVGIGSLILVHCQHSLFIFDSTDSLHSDNGKVQLASIDVWETTYRELTTHKLGFCGLRKREEAIVGAFGYIFYDADGQQIVRYDAGKLDFIDKNITNFIHKIPKDYYANWSDDIQRDRTIIRFTNGTNYLTLSYNYKFASFVSIHNYNFDESYNTKIKTYFNINDKTTIANFNENKFSDIANISIIFNNNYEIIKYIESIIYKLYEITNVANADETALLPFPVEERTNLYAGNKITIYSEFGNTNAIDVTNSTNKVSDYTKPYWRLGNWHLNLIRNKANNYIDKQYNNMNDIEWQKQYRLAGNWFVVKFDFNTNKCVELETIECKLINAEIV